MGLTVSPPSSGGVSSSTPGLPVWTYTAGAMAEGKLTSDNASIAATTSIEVSSQPKSAGTAALLLYFTSCSSGATALQITSLSTGKTSSFAINDVPSDAGDKYILPVSVVGGEGGAWSGDYSVLVVPRFPPLKTDSGWTANASVGDKTQSVADYSGSGIDGTMAAALELVSSGLGTALQQDEARIRELIKKLQAIETALAANLRPNE